MQMTTQFCMPHWQMLVDEVDRQGLGALKAEGGQEAMRKIMAQQQDGLTVDNFEPLAQAMMAITINLWQRLGPAVLAPSNGHCPLCAANKWHDEGHCNVPDCHEEKAFDKWIAFAVGDEVRQWKALQA